jgi:hypothetical protein
MNTMDLNEAAAFLRMNPEVLRQKAQAGEVPGAKPGKRWVFLEEDLVQYIRSQYAPDWRATRVADDQEETSCHFSAETKLGGSTSVHQAEQELDDLLGRRTA